MNQTFGEKGMAEYSDGFNPASYTIGHIIPMRVHGTRFAEAHPAFAALTAHPEHSRFLLLQNRHTVHPVEKLRAHKLIM